MLALLLLLEKGLALLFLLLLDACELVVLLEVFFGEVADVALTLFKIVDSRLLRAGQILELALVTGERARVDASDQVLPVAAPAVDVLSLGDLGDGVFSVLEIVGHVVAALAELG